MKIDCLIRWKLVLRRLIHIIHGQKIWLMSKNQSQKYSKKKVVLCKWHFLIFPYFFVEIYLFVLGIIGDFLVLVEIYLFLWEKKIKSAHLAADSENLPLHKTTFCFFWIFLRLIFLHHPKQFWPWIISKVYPHDNG